MRSVQLRKVIFQFGTPSMLWCALVADSTWALAERRGHIQSLCVFMAGVRHKSSTLFQSEIARDRGPEALGAIHL